MRLCEYLKKSSMSQAEFARRLGVTRQAVQAWCQGKRRPRPELVKKIIAETGGLCGWEDVYASNENEY
ncbi:MAG: helix-turn-helix transcriptional regulator [Candidatus Methanomethylicaceae archaeon]